MYAPRYRRTNGTPFTRPSADGERAIDLAYGDVRRAFDAFETRRGAGRPFILAGHSQGSVLAERLLYEVISGGPLRDRLVAAYLPGAAVSADGLRERVLGAGNHDPIEYQVFMNLRENAGLRAAAFVATGG